MIGSADFFHWIIVAIETHLLRQPSSISNLCAYTDVCVDVFTFASELALRLRWIVVLSDSNRMSCPEFLDSAPSSHEKSERIFGTFHV